MSEGMRIVVITSRTHHTTKGIITMNTTYNSKVVNRIDRVVLVLAVAISAVLILSGASAGQEAQASTSTGTTPVTSLEAHSTSGGTLNG